MNELEPMIFPEDTEILDPIICLDVIAHGNLKVFSINIKGLLAVASTLEVERQLIVKGPANIGGFIRCNNCIAKFNDSCKVGKNIEGGTIVVDGFLEAENVDVTDLIVNGSVDVKGDVIAEKEIPPCRTRRGPGKGALSANQDFFAYNSQAGKAAVPP